MMKRQRGAATLLVTIVMMVLLLIVSAVMTKIGLLELKTAANTNRAKEALHHAQGALDYGAEMYLETASEGTRSLTINGTTASVVTTLDSGLVTVRATGESFDTTGSATVEEKLGRVPTVAFGALPPLMSNGNFPPSGTFSIVSNPNGGGDGVPVSAWSGNVVTSGVASWQTCNMDEFLYDGTNAAQAKSTMSDGFVLCPTCKCQQADTFLCEAVNGLDPVADCDDIILNDPVVDAFENTFGFEGAAWAEFRNAVAKQDVACSDLDANTGDRFYAGGADDGDLPLIWITGDCTIPANTQVGSYDAPFILVVHGDLTMNSGGSFFGLLFAFSDIYTASPVEDNDITINGSPTIYGVILINADIDLPTGAFTLVYSQNILDELSNEGGGEFYELSRKPGSWSDFN